MKKLKKGDCIGIIAPAGFVKNNENLKAAILLLERWGLHVKFGKHLYKKHHHFAGTDTNRTADFQYFLEAEDIKAIWCARGGYGSVRIVDKLDFSNFQKNPKWIIGYSDITVFHHAIDRLNLESIHAIMPTSTTSILESKSAVESLRKLLFGEELSYKIKSNKNNKKGIAKGQLIGGNLSLMSSLLGTEYSIKTKNKILFIEEIGEYKYRIDRMLQSLKLNGYFKNCNGLILGAFSNIPKNNPNFGMSIEEIILDLVSEYNFPVCFNFNAGHITNNNALVFGRKTILEIKEINTTLKFSH